MHLPVKGEFFLEIFANKIDDGNAADAAGATMPFRLKCACKFKILCAELKHKMHALPNCASGEWGPAKAIRHFRLFPISHETVSVGLLAHNGLNLVFGSCHFNSTLKNISQLYYRLVDLTGCHFTVASLTKLSNVRSACQVHIAAGDSHKHVDFIVRRCRYFWTMSK